MRSDDSFKELARYYDAIMAHVDYDHWELTSALVSSLLPRPFVHLDAACGTGTLLERMRRMKWHSFGVDLSAPMLRANRGRAALPVAVADLRALPFHGSIDYITCLFDSMNFLLAIEEVERALGEMAGALRPGGILYFDIVTERMVLDYFAGQRWTERAGRLSTRWNSRYFRKDRISETEIRVNREAHGVIRERMYPRADIEAAVAKAGLELLCLVDAETWGRPKRSTVRLDLVAARAPSPTLRRDLGSLAKTIAAQLTGHG